SVRIDRPLWRPTVLCNQRIRSRAAIRPAQTVGRATTTIARVLPATPNATRTAVHGSNGGHLRRCFSLLRSFGARVGSASRGESHLHSQLGLWHWKYRQHRCVVARGRGSVLSSGPVDGIGVCGAGPELEATYYRRRYRGNRSH